MAQGKPNVKDTTDEARLTDKLKEFMTDLRAQVEHDDEDRQNWINKMVTATNQRLGVKRRTTRPYPGAPNIPLPETDKLIKKATPNLVLSSWAPKKMILVKVEEGVAPNPEFNQKAKRAEAAMNMLFRNKMNWFYKLNLAADYAKEKGHAIFRVIEDFKDRIVSKVIDLDTLPEGVEQQLKSMTKSRKRVFINERFSLDPDDEDDIKITDNIIEQFNNGTRVIEFDIVETTSMPNVEIPLPTKVIVPNYATDINISPRVTYEFFLTKEQLQTKMDSGIYEDKDLDILDMSGRSQDDEDLVEKQKARNEGIEERIVQSDLFRIRETLCWFRLKGSKEPARKWVFTFLADVFSAEEARLQDMPFPYEYDGWNYEKHDNEVKDPRYYNSRGIPEQIRALQEFMERSVNNMIIRDEMNNTPMWEVLSTSDILDSSIRFIPGQRIPVKQIGAEIKRLNEPASVDISSERIMQNLKAYTEEYMGSTDQLFRNATNAGGAKTLGEVKEGIRQGAGQLNIDVINWNNTLTRVYKKVFDTLAERLDESIFIDGIEITKEDFNFPAEVKSNGNLEVSDAMFATQKAQNRIMMVERFLQGGIANQEDYFNAAQDWLEKDGVKDPDRFTTTPQEILQSQLAQLQQQVQQLQAQGQQLQEANQKGFEQIEKSRRTVKKIEAKQKIAEGGSSGPSRTGNKSSK